MLDLALSVGVGRAFLARAARTILVLVSALMAATAPAQGADSGPADVLLILDASGSMFNELDDGRYRITAAKEALATFISRLPDMPDLRVGLRVYGSQMFAIDDGACEDSLLRVPVSRLDRGLLLGTVRETEALGATPIAYSLELAAQDLQGATGRKVVVLVTDGEESCGGDVRAVAERLAARGIEIDLHIIGFALTPEASASFDGIGTFQNANSAAELAEALGRAVELPPAAAGVLVTVSLTRDGEPVADGAAVTFADALGAGDHAFRPGPGGVFTAEVPPGSYTANVSDAFSGTPLSFGGLSVTAEGENEFAFELSPAFEVVLAVSPTDPVMGSRLEVTYSGAAANASAWITVAPVEAPDDILVSVEGVSGASGAVEVTVPFEESLLEARYVLHLPEGGIRVVGRSEAFTARRVEVSLESPEEVPTGASFTVSWDGPDNEGDMLTVAPEGVEPLSYLAYTFTQFGNPGTLTAPVDPGRYEVRYVAGAGGGVLASRPIVVSAAEVAVTVPAEVSAGSPVSVPWTGPDGPGDMVVFAPKDAPATAFLSYAFTAFGPNLDLVAPVEPGAYEVRYLSGSERRVLASSVVTVTPAVVSLDAPGEVGAGAVFAVAWTGPNAANDYLTIVPVGAAAGTMLSVAFTVWGATLELTAPDEPGSYEVRYVSGFSRTTLSSVPVTVR